jgi:hypothetical protein
MVMLILIQVNPNILVAIQTNNKFIQHNNVKLLKIIDANILTS